MPDVNPALAAASNDTGRGGGPPAGVAVNEAVGLTSARTVTVADDVSPFESVTVRATL